MFILPPDFMKYRDVVSEKELENIEIKFLVKDTQIVKNPKIKDITEKIDIENDKEGKIEIILEEKLDKDKYKNKSHKAKVEFKLLAVGILDGQVNVNITISNDEDFSKSIIFNNEKNNTVRLLVDLESLNIPQFTLSSNKNINLEASEAKVDYMFDDINIIYPTGLFLQSWIRISIFRRL